LILDAHAHCGVTLPYEEVNRYWLEGGIDGGVVFSPVEEIYDRYDYSFIDSAYYRGLRQQVHKYLDELQAPHLYRLWFVWNDFALPRSGFVGVKWHRHAYEPHYNYANPACEQFLQHCYSRQLPILLEEELGNTLEFVKRIDQQTTVIIPHMGGLNGGYRNLKRSRLFENLSVYVDTSLAMAEEISDFVRSYGPDRIMFGSDYPFGNPVEEKKKIERLFGGEEREKILGLNAYTLYEAVKSRIPADDR